MRLAGMLPLLALFAASPAIAETADPFALIAAVTAGLADGGKVAIGELGAGKVARTGPRAYVVNLPSGQASFIFEQPAPCVFTESSQMKGRQPLTVRFNLGLVSAINFAARGQQEGLNVVALQFAGSGDIVQLVADDGSAQSAAPEASIITSMPIDELRRAAMALHAACPAR